MQDGRKYSEWERWEQLSHATGVVRPLYIFVETHGTVQGSLTADDTTVVLKIKFDFRHGAIAVTLALQEFKHQDTVAS